MRALVKIALFCVGALLSVVIAGFIYLFYYSRDLPDINALAAFAPTQVAHASDACLNSVAVVPYDLIGQNLRRALTAAEVREDDPPILIAEYRAFTDQAQFHRATLSFQIDRSMFCTPSRYVARQFADLRTAAQLEQRFSRRDLFTIYANRAYFGDNVIGVGAAAQYFFHKQPNELDVAQAALLAGLIRSPTRYSSHRHPDRAIQRRNEVIDAMVTNASVIPSEGQSAKDRDLGLLQH